MFEQGRQLLREWLDGLDKQLVADAARASLAEHPTIIGDQREKVFTEALREFLPPSLHIGTGKVIAPDTGPSRQVDVVIFDGRFPVLKQGNSALYPVEGVIATIEVKSVLTDEEFHRALDNCHSVMTLNPAFIKEDADRFMAARCAGGKSKGEALEEVAWDLMPRTYVFALDGMKGTTTLTDSLARWLQKGCVRTRSRALLPSVIVTGGVVGIAWGDPMRITPNDPSHPHPPDELIVMFSFSSETRFGILASHLLWHVEQRLTLVDGSSPIRRTIRGYLPFEDYVNGVVKDGPYSLTMWTDQNAAVEEAKAKSS